MSAPYGEPTCFAPTDIDHNGVVDGSDADYFEVLFNPESSPSAQDRYDAGDHRADLNPDGVIDSKDADVFYDLCDPGDKYDSRGRLSSTETGYSGGSGYIDNRIGYAGYVWDPHLRLYHVRHRVYDPNVMRGCAPYLLLLSPRAKMEAT